MTLYVADILHRKIYLQNKLLKNDRVDLLKN